MRRPDPVRVGVVGETDEETQMVVAVRKETPGAGVTGLLVFAVDARQEQARSVPSLCAVSVARSGTSEEAKGARRPVSDGGGTESEGATVRNETEGPCFSPQQVKQQSVFRQSVQSASHAQRHRPARGLHPPVPLPFSPRRQCIRDLGAVNLAQRPPQIFPSQLKQAIALPGRAPASSVSRRQVSK